MPYADTASLKTVRSILDDLQTSPNRTMGQNFLVNANVLDRIVTTADVTNDDHVLEIGPGLGALTQRLIAKAGAVTAIEKDPCLLQWLQCQSWILESNTKLISGDALKISWADTALPDENVKIVANLPYSVSKPLLRCIMETWRPHLQSATIMVQREVAIRLIAKPGDSDWGPMSIMTQLYSKATRCFDIAPGSFWPAPAVTSSVVHLKLLKEPSIALVNERLFWQITRAAFSQRRKQLLNSLYPLLPDKAKLIEILDICEIDASRRPQTLKTSELSRLSETFLKYTKNK
ncbi:MAG: 16S rRNA (adenine(1518)-N(6)/adenine(1519)-N(6))-dimethyltransferase RsmA [Abditibacteriaceae bacterium]